MVNWYQQLIPCTQRFNMRFYFNFGRTSLIWSSAERRRVEVLWKRFLKNWQTNNQQQFTRTISWPFPATRYMKIPDPSFSSLCSFLGSFFFVPIIVLLSCWKSCHIFHLCWTQGIAISLSIVFALCSPKHTNIKKSMSHKATSLWYLANEVVSKTVIHCQCGPTTIHNKLFFEVQQ